MIGNSSNDPQVGNPRNFKSNSSSMDEEQGSVVQNTSRENRKQSSNTLKSDTFAAWTFYLWTSRDRCKLCVCVYTHIYIYIWYALSFRGHDIRLDILLLLRYENINDAFGKLSGVIKETNKFFFFFLFNPFLQTSLYFQVKEN